MTFFRRIFIVALAAAIGPAVWCYAGSNAIDTVSERENKPAMELGGYVTVDYLRASNAPYSPEFGIGEVDLGANVNISEEVVASVVIMAENRLDYLWIDQALVSYKPASLPMELLFGQQTFNHGLLSTRLISDPLMLENMDNMELVAPGVIVNGVFSRFTAGLGFTLLYQDSADNLTLETVPVRNYAGVVNIDIPLQDESLARLSSLVYQDYFDIGLAANVLWKSLTIDAEGVMMVNAPGDLKQSGLYGGAHWAINDRFGVALRADAFSNDRFTSSEKRFAAGTTVAIKDGIFAALEIARIMPENAAATPYQTVALQIGLEQKLSLPGFQRKTLTRE